MSFLKEATGGFSSNRLIFIIGSIWAMATTTVLLLKGTEIAGLVAYFGAIEGVWVGLKLGQKPMEQKLKQDGSA